VRKTTSRLPSSRGPSVPLPVGRAAACSLRVRVTTVCIAAVAGVTASLRWSMSGCRPETKTFTAAMQVDACWGGGGGGGEGGEGGEGGGEGGGVKGTSYLGVATLGFVATPALGTRLASGALGRLGWRGQYLDLDSGHGGRTRAHTHGNTHAHDNTHDNTTCGWRCVGERTGWGWRGRQSSLVLRLDLRWEGL